MNIKNKIPTLATLLNAFFGLLVIINCIEEEYSIAALFLIIAAVLDFLDGKIARRFHQDSVFGRELDSLADVISFGVAPAVFVYSIGNIEPVSIFVLILFLTGGMLRLARYNVTSHPHFIGMPITMNGLLVPIIYFIAPDILIYYLLISGFLMVSTIKFPKLGKKK